MTVFEFLEKAFEADNFFAAVQRALAIPTCRIVPYCDVFVQVIKTGIASDYQHFMAAVASSPLSSSTSSPTSPLKMRATTTSSTILYQQQQDTVWWREEVRKVLPNDVHFNTKQLELVEQQREKNNFRSTNIDAQIAIERFIAIGGHQMELGKLVPQNMLDYLR